MALACGLLLLASCSRPPGDAAAEGGYGVTLYGLSGRVRGLDPACASDVASILALSSVYEGLLQYSYLERPYAVEPCLCEALPDFSGDGLTVTFRIRRNIHFQDDPCFAALGGRGRELTAEDFIYSIKRVADVKTGSGGYWAFDGRIAGLDAFRAASKVAPVTDYGLEVEGLRAAGTHTLEIRLTRPYPQLPWVLALSYAMAVPREAVEFYGRDFAMHPVGTGPYVLKSHLPNYRLEFARNPKWAETGRIERYPAAGPAAAEAAGLLADAGKAVPFADRIVQYIVADSSTMWLMFLNGQVEASDISRDNWNSVIGPNRALAADLAERGIRLHSAPALETHYIGFNMDDPVVGPNLKLRQALACAFDAEEWSRFHDRRVIRASGPLPPGVAGFEDKPPLYAFDLPRARALLAEAGYPEGRDPATGRRLILKLDVGRPNDPEMRASVELMAGFFDRIGVMLEPVYNTFPAFLSRVERRQAQMFRLGWVADYPDGQNFLQLFYGPNASPGPNRSNYADAEFDAMYEKARALPDGAERRALYGRMSDRVCQSCPWLFLHHPLAYGLSHGWLKNYAPHDFPYGMSKYYRVDPEARRAWRGGPGRAAR